MRQKNTDSVECKFAKDRLQEDIRNLETELAEKTELITTLPK